MPRPASISPELLQTFVAVVHADGDAMSAAHQLGINQPSMSKRLACLQHAGRFLRKPWLERIGKKWNITAEGQRVFPAVEQLIQRYRVLTEDIDYDRSSVVIGCGDGLAAGFLRPIAARLVNEHPDIRFRVSAMSELRRIESLAGGMLDLAVTRLDPKEIAEIAHRPTDAVELFTESYVMAAAEKSPFSDEFSALPDKGMNPRAIMSFPLIVPKAESRLRKDWDRRLREADLIDRIRIAAEVDPWTTVVDYVRSGIGVGLIPTSVADEAEGLIVRPLPPRLGLEFPVRLICRKAAGTDDLDLSEHGKVVRQATLEYRK